ncbi:shikimate dehydrogenase [Beijerinckia sp. L45]|uniref:shikimate dehydrogenase n=1 Tax=Beijerinckia sp. L45 TaxID=1641855 RepID=UPI00131AB50C|nr:shikimate dehydrogenase [Beijerinckia sp. L45]
MSVAPRAFVVGWPIAHSRSPLIHGTWLDNLGLAGSYEKLAIEPDAFPAFVQTLRENGFVGGNVTIPHKAVAASLCTELTPTARRLGVANTLWFENGRLCGDTTDGAGFLGALDQDAPGWDRRRALAIVLGAGGASRAIVDALLQRGFARIIVANRSVERADLLLRQLRDSRCEAASFDAAEHATSRADLLVNTTSAGMHGQAELAFDIAALPDHAVVNDIVYVPRRTALLRRAEACGLRTVGGLGMLLHQAVPGFARWFGVRPAVTPELRAIVEADIEAAQA